eukprot:COSAG05_NODE_196_length_14546_cov_55.423548_18_plen_120_part_00
MCMKYQNIFCRMRIRNNVCIFPIPRRSAAAGSLRWVFARKPIKSRLSRYCNPLDVYFNEYSSIVALERPSMYLERLTSPLLASYRNVVQSYNIPASFEYSCTATARGGRKVHTEQVHVQ